MRRQLVRSLTAMAAVIAFGVIGYTLLGFPLLDAVYQTATTMTTVGFKEVVEPFGTSEKIFTIIFVFVGVGVVLYTLTSLLGLIIEGWLGHEWERRKMERRIDSYSGHSIVCGWGRVGRHLAPAEQIRGRGGRDRQRRGTAGGPGS